nr:YjcZ family sporulation protein [Bacillus pumilus]
MGAGYSNGFALLVVLFILLIIVGAKDIFTN